MADTTATAVRSTAHVITLADRRAAPSITDTTDRDTIALHVQAENALSMALSMLRNPQGTAADLERATARACRAATLLRRACAAQAEGRTA
jgi:phosphosulfolactate phosphohydrolase-like enzyme